MLIKAESYNKNASVSHGSIFYFVNLRKIKFNGII